MYLYDLNLPAKFESSAKSQAKAISKLKFVRLSFIKNQRKEEKKNKSQDHD